jgi:hypothetical protein
VHDKENLEASSRSLTVSIVGMIMLKRERPSRRARVQIANQLTGRLLPLKHYNALCAPWEYFPQTIVRLREKYLNVLLARRYAAPCLGVCAEGCQSPRRYGGRGF